MGRNSNAMEILVSTAQELFMKYSYTAVSVEKICEAAGVNKGSFYHFFKSKQELLLVVLEANWLFLQSIFFANINTVKDKPKEKLQLFISNLYSGTCMVKQKYGIVMGCPVGSLGVELATQNENVRMKVDSIFVEFAKFFEELLVQAQSQKIIDAQVDVKLRSQMMLTYVQGLLLMAKTKNNEQLLKDLEPGLFSFLN